MPFDLTIFNISLINVLQATYLFNETYHGSRSRFNFLAFSFLSSRYDHNNYNYYRIITLIYHCKTTSLAIFLICPTEKCPSQSQRYMFRRLFLTHLINNSRPTNMFKKLTEDSTENLTRWRQVGKEQLLPHCCTLMP